MRVMSIFSANSSEKKTPKQNKKQVRLFSLMFSNFPLKFSKNIVSHQHFFRVCQHYESAKSGFKLKIYHLMHKNKAEIK